MPWNAVDALDDALEETRELLLPFDLATWLRLAVVTVFAGLSAPQSPTFSWEVPPEQAADTAREVTDPEVVAALVGIAVVVAAVALAVAVVGAVMEFVLVDAVRSQRVRILAPFRRHLGAGLRLFAFRLAVILGVLLALAGVVAPVGAAYAFDSPVWLLALVVTVPLLLVAGLFAAAVSEFTTAFVVPLMVDEEVGVLAGWRRLWPTLRGEWREFAVYALVKAVLLFASSLVLGFAVAVVAVPVGLGALVAGALSPVAVVAVFAAMAVGVVVVAVVSVPVVTYLRYHSLLTLDRSGVAFSLR